VDVADVRVAGFWLAVVLDDNDAADDSAAGFSVVLRWMCCDVLRCDEWNGCAEWDDVLM